MARSLATCLTQKKELIEQFYSVDLQNEQEVSSYTHQLKCMLDELCKFSNIRKISSQKRMQEFYGSDVMETLAYYLYVRELKKLVFQIPWDMQKRIAFIEQKREEYCAFVMGSSDYDAFNANDYKCDVSAIKEFLKMEKTDEPWLLFDANCPFFYPAYFRVINLLLEQLKKWISSEDHLHLDTNRGALWGISKTDLCLFVYAFYYGLDLNNRKISILECAQQLGRFFNIKMGNDVYQIYNAKKNRNDIDQSVLGKGYHYVESNFDETNK